MNTYSKHSFYLAHKKIIIKSIEELQFEEVLTITNNNGEYSLELGGAISYKFNARIGSWGNIQIKWDTFTKNDNSSLIEHYTVNTFFIEVQSICNIDDITLAQYIEEANNTIYSDLKVFENLAHLDISSLSYQYIDQILPGHPKLIMNKGRIGWTHSDIQKYAPEFRNQFQMRWVAIKKSLLITGCSSDFELNDLAPKSVTNEVDSMIELKEFSLFPIHPWQWDRYIQVQYKEQICCGDIIDLGLRGDYYTPQSSIRTLTNTSQKHHFDIKCALSILNTSCVRGIPTKYIENGHHLSDYIEKVITNDPYLVQKVDVLKEVAAAFVPNRYYESLESSSYRYKELFGCVWRESVASKVCTREIAIPAAGLLLENFDESLVSSIILNSGLSTKEWVRSYFDVIILPLYHLQVEHGFGLVAHGQNTILVLRDYKPYKILIKDFHGDLRISTDSKHLDWEFSSVLDKLTPEHLIHDLFTGHFITVLRYFSRILEDRHMLKESDFYAILGESINNYNSCHPKVNSYNNLLKPEFEKVLVNKVRFIAGYSETNSRLKPLLGSPIKNPLYTNLRDLNE